MRLAASFFLDFPVHIHLCVGRIQQGKVYAVTVPRCTVGTSKFYMT